MTFLRLFFSLLVTILLMVIISCDDRETNQFQENSYESSIDKCDTLIPFTIDLLKNDEYEIEFEGMKFPERIQFTYLHNTSKGNKIESQIPFFNSTFRELKTFSSFDNIDIDTIFNKKDLIQYSSKQLSEDCINWKTINQEIIDGWSDESEKKSTKKSGFDYSMSQYFSISTPLLSKTGEFIYVEIDLNCFGLCGWGMSYLFRKVNNEWNCLGRDLRVIS